MTNVRYDLGVSFVWELAVIAVDGIDGLGEDGW